MKVREQKPWKQIHINFNMWQKLPSRFHITQWSSRSNDHQIVLNIGRICSNCLEKALLSRNTTSCQRMDEASPESAHFGSDDQVAESCATCRRLFARLPNPISHCPGRSCRRSPGHEANVLRPGKVEKDDILHCYHVLVMVDILQMDFCANFMRICEIMRPASTVLAGFVVTLLNIRQPSLRDIASCFSNFQR
jgi:hypothetical protein